MTTELLLILAAVNVVTFLLYGADKAKARKGKWRIPEAQLLFCAFIGGSFGAWAGMKVWRHKTNHWKFRILVPLLVILHTALLALFGVSTYLLDYSLKPGETVSTAEESKAYLRDNYPGTVEWADSMAAMGALRDTFITNASGQRLHAILASHRDAKGTAVLVHGYTETSMGMAMLGRMYYDSLSYNILMPDQAHHGQSEGEAVQMGWLDRLNTERWIGVADSLWSGCPIILHGISMGAATVMMCSGDSLPTAVKGIIEDCGYTSVWDEFSYKIQEEFHLPVHPILDVASWLCDVRYGWDFKEASALEQVRRSTLPMLFIHGDKDDYVPSWMVYQLFAAKRQGEKSIWIALGSEHAVAYRDHQGEYLSEVRGFINGITKEQ